MSAQRYISTSFWDDAWVQSLDPSEKFLYLYFLTNPLANIAGVYEITIRRVCFDTGYNQDTVAKVIERFGNDKKAYWVDGFIILPNAPKHQKWQSSADTKKGIDRILADLPEGVRGALKGAGYAYPGLPKAPRRPPVGPLEGAQPTLPNSTLPNLTQPSGEKKRASAKTPEKKIYGEFGNVFLSDADFSKLTETYGPDQTRAIIERLSAWKADKGKTTPGNDLAKMRQWVIEAVGAKPLPPPAPVCPLCGHELSDNICPNAACPQYEEGYEPAQSA